MNHEQTCCKRLKQKNKQPIQNWNPIQYQTVCMALLCHLVNRNITLLLESISYVRSGLYKLLTRIILCHRSDHREECCALPSLSSSTPVSHTVRVVQELYAGHSGDPRQVPEASHDRGAGGQGGA